MSDNLHSFNDEVLEQDQIITDLTALTTRVGTNETDITTINNLNIANKFAGSVSSGLKTLIEGNDTDIANIKTKTDFVSVTQAVDLDTMETNIATNNAKNSYPSGDATKVGNISVSSAVNLNTMNTSITTNTNAIDAVELKTDFISVTQNVDLDTMESNIATNNAKIGFPSTLNSLLAVSDTHELEVGTGAGVPRIRLRGGNNNAISSELIFIDAVGNNPEYFQGMAIRFNSSGNRMEIVSDQGNDGTAEECVRIDRSTRESQFKKVCVYLDEIEAKGASSVVPANANLMMTTALGSLPGYSSSYYPTIKTASANIYFSTNNAYNAYIGSTNVGQLDFTAQHKAVPVNNNLINDLSNNIGKIVISNGEISSLIEDSSGIFQATTGKNGITINEAIPKVLLSNQYKDKRIFGVISDGRDNEPNGEKHYRVGALTSVIHSDISDNRLFINSGGEGAILVSDICGNIENGDLITTSILEGIGCKQNDDLIHSYTIAKATIDCEFDLNSNNYNCYIENGNKISLISCIYLL